MKIRSKLLTKVTSLIIAAILLTAPLVSVAFAQGQLGDIVKTESLADALGLGENESVEVIVKFSAPSLLELDIEADSSYAAGYEQQLLSEQSAILDPLGIVPEFSYTGVINAAAITATAREIRLLEQMSGVADVYLSQAFTAIETDQYHANSIDSADMMGINAVVPEGCTGDGVLVAVLDSGITFSHEAFNNTKYVQNPALTSEDVINLGFGSGYYNEKIPFYREYSDSEVPDCVDTSGHGSHVAGIIAGYAENEDGTVKFSGIAPGAQICAMRVLNEVGGCVDSTIIAALEDAYKLGVDVINISFGRDSAFRLGGDQYVSYNGIYENLEDAGVVVVCSAGNLGSMAENTPRYVLDENCVDYGTLSLPAIYPGNIGVGSINNTQFYTAVLSIGGKNYRYSDPADSKSPLRFENALGGSTADIAYFDNYGKEEDYVGVDVTGKIVAVKRGELSFTDKCRYAAEAGAIGLIVINSATDPMGGVVINNQTIPAIMVEHGAAQHLPMTDYVVTLTHGMVNIENGGELSYFSAVGVTPDLEIGLDILGIGGTVTSVKSQTTDEYATHSGTSMAAPTVTGTYVLLYQLFKERDESGEQSRADITSYIEDVTQSTATLLTDDFGNLYSPRFQGAGFINFERAASATSYITTPLVSLGYDKSASGSLSVEYELVNLDVEDKKYTATVSAITDSFMQISPVNYKNNVTPKMLDAAMYTYEIYVNGVALATGGEIVLPAGESATVKLELALSPATAATLSAAFPYGYFLDGFVEFYDVTDPSVAAMHGGYVSFVGDWLAAPAIEPLTQLDVMDWIHSIGADIEDLLPYFAAGHIDANYSYTSLLVGIDANYGSEHYVGQNPLANGAYIPSYADRNAISAAPSNADKVLYDSLYLSPSLLRSCKSVRYVVTNSQTGEVYASESQSYVIKDIPYGNYQYLPLSSFTFEPVYTAPNALGQITEQYIPTGTEVTIAIYTLLDHPDATERLEAEYQLTVDYTAPVLDYDYDADAKTLTVRCSDSEYLAGIVLEAVDASYNVGERVESCIYADQTPGLEHVEVFDLSAYTGDSISITVSDYAGNMVTTLLSLASGSVSNIKGMANVGDGLSVDFADDLYLYGAVDFTVVPAEGYCFAEDFVLLVNGKELEPVSVENGSYLYSIILTEETLNITSVGAATHTFVSTVTKEETCVSEGELCHICSNCSCIGAVEAIPPCGHVGGTPVILREATCSEAGVTTVSCTQCGVVLSTDVIEPIGHTPGEFVITKEATCDAPGLGIVRCTDCQSILDAQVIPATGHDHTEGSQATAFSPAVCGICGESYGAAAPNAILVISIVLSSVALLATVSTAVVILIKRKR